MKKLFARAMIAAVVSWGGAWAAGCGSDGVVGGGCADGFTDCDGTCLDLEHDPLNCGACALQCAPGQSCMVGVCGIPASAGGGGGAPGNPGAGGASGKAGASGASPQGGTGGATSHGGTAGASGASGHGGAAGGAGGHGGSAGMNAGGASGTSGASGSAGQSAGGIGGSSGEGGQGGVAGSSAGGAMAGGSAGASGGPGAGGVGGDNGGSAGTSGNTGAGGDAGASGGPGAGGMSGASGLGGAGGDTTGGGGMSGASGLGGVGGDTTGAGGTSAGGNTTGAGGDTTGGSAGSSGSAGDTGAGGAAGGSAGGAAGGGASGSAGNAGSGGGCPPPTIDCSTTCVNPNDDPTNCGGCDIVCPTFVCQAKKCVGSLDGHQVLIGMDFSNVPGNKVDSRRVLGNASFLNGPRPDGSWNVLGFNPSASPTVVAVDAVITATAAAHGITKLNFTHLTLASDVVDQLTKADFDVVIVYDQPTAPAGSLGTAGTTLADAFTSFTKQGGDVVVLSGGTGTNEMWALVANAQIMGTAAFQQIPIPVPQAGPALVNNNQANSVGIGVSSVFAASPNTGWWTIAADPTISDIIDVSSNGKPVVLHRAVAP